MRNSIKKFMESGAIDFMLEEAALIIKGEKSSHVCPDRKVQDNIWKIIEAGLLQAVTQRSIEVQQTADILSLLKDGTITVAEAKMLMETLRVQNEVNILPDLEAKVAEMKK